MARPSLTSSSSNAAPRSSTETMADLARVLPPARGQLPPEPDRADAKLGIGDTFLGEGTGGIEGPRYQRVPRVPVLLPHAQARRLRAVQARDGALLPDARLRPRSDRNARCDHASSRPSSTRYPDSALMPEEGAKLREAQDRLSQDRTTGRRVLLPSTLVSGRHRSLRHSAQDRPGFTRRIRSISTWESLVKAASRPRRSPTSNGSSGVRAE